MDVPLEGLKAFRDLNRRRVSILVLVDVPLEESMNQSIRSRSSVSILVLVDVPLEDEYILNKITRVMPFQSLF